jgi:hypothetical protein
MTDKENTFLSWLYQGTLFVGIVSVTVLFVHYGMNLLYPMPEYDGFCENRIAQPADNLTKNQCEAIGGSWEADGIRRPVPAGEDIGTSTASSTATSTPGYCDRDHDCRESYQAAQDVHDRTGFAIMASIGMLIALVGFYGGGSVLFVSLGAAGTITLLTAVARFWSQAGGWLQFGVLGLVLLVFLLTAYRQELHE